MRNSYTEDTLRKAVADNISIAGVMRSLNLRPAGGTHTYLTKRIATLGIDTTHFMRTSHNKGKPAPTRKTWQQILVLGEPTDYRAKAVQLRRALLEYGLTYECSECKISEWQGKQLVLHIDHISGIIYDNRPENLRFLCPNCHSQTDTYCRPKGD